MSSKRMPCDESARLKKNTQEHTLLVQITQFTDIEDRAGSTLGI